MSLTDVLQEFGLSENEAKVYLACLELGLANIGEISRKSRVKRTTIYTIIGALKGRGLVSESRKGTKALFSAEDPEKLLKVSEERCGKLKEKYFLEVKDYTGASGKFSIDEKGNIVKEFEIVEVVE